MEKTTQRATPFYEHFADDPFYLFLSKETFLFDEPHYHESIELTYIVRGKTTVHLNGSAHDLSEGDIFLCNKQHVHFYENYDHDKLALCVVLSNKYTHDFREVHKNTVFPSFLTNREYNAQIYALLLDWFNFKDRTFLSDCAYANLLLDKIVKLYGFDTEPFDPINTTAIQFINYITDNYNQNISLESAAKHFGYSKEHFSKKFKQTVGKNFLSFLNTIRLQKAIELMNDTDQKRTFNEICSMCGFNNPSSLYRHLRKNNPDDNE